MENLAVTDDKDCEIARLTDSKYNRYLASISPSVFARNFEYKLPEHISGLDFLERYGEHADIATNVLPDHVYTVRVNTKYAVLENNRVILFYQLMKGCQSNQQQNGVYSQLGELMYQSGLYRIWSRLKCYLFNS